MSKQKITIVGCGIIGLCAGVTLAEAGHDVEIVARELPPHTTSNWAGAIWMPYRAFPRDRVMAWGKITYDKLVDFLSIPEAGVVMRDLLDLYRDPVSETPWWLSGVASYRELGDEERPAGFRAGYLATIPFIDPNIHLPYLMDQFTSLGGRIQQRELNSLDTLAGAGRIIVNCTGIGARDLVGDDTVFPIRGQLIRVKAPQVKQGMLAGSHKSQLTYIFPRINDCVLGGTAYEMDWNLTPDDEDTTHIIDSTRQVLPALADAEIIEVGVGLRPGRPTVRLEREQLKDGTAVIHCYGHGGAGFTLSWGCAEEISALISA